MLIIFPLSVIWYRYMRNVKKNINLSLLFSVEMTWCFPVQHAPWWWYQGVGKCCIVPSMPCMLVFQGSGQVQRGGQLVAGCTRHQGENTGQESSCSECLPYLTLIHPFHFSLHLGTGSQWQQASPSSVVVSNMDMIRTLYMGKTTSAFMNYSDGMSNQLSNVDVLQLDSDWIGPQHTMVVTRGDKWILGGYNV